MKILLCSPNPLDSRLGAAKVLIEAARALEIHGLQCTLVSDEEIAPGIRKLSGIKKVLKYSEQLREFLLRNARNYQVVDYDHAYLPYQRSAFSPHTLMVARAVLLAQHFDQIKIPRAWGIRSLIGLLIKGPLRHLEQRIIIRQADRTCGQADLINVANDWDKTALISRGFPEKKIAVIPYGLFQEKLSRFQSAAIPEAPSTPLIAFVGTFDMRKGAKEFPGIVKKVTQAIPDARFRLLGARYRDASEVLRFFPSDLHSRIEVISQFDPENLPALLAPCSLGIFPSYVEGFGFGVLEMLATGLPVIAYNSPGPPMMLPSQLLIDRGNSSALAARVIEILSSPTELIKLRSWAKSRAGDFLWENIGQMTAEIYTKSLKQLKSL